MAWRIAVLIFAVIVLINYFPVLSGRIPFPRDLVVRHSAWNGQPQEQLPELIDIVAMFEVAPPVSLTVYVAEAGPL